MSKQWLRPILRNTYTLVKVTETVVDDYYGSTSETTVTYVIKGNVIPYTLEDIRFDVSGKIKIGDARGYFYHIYEGQISIEVGDRIEDNYYTPDGNLKEKITYEVSNKFLWKFGNLKVVEVFLRRI